MDGLAFDTKSLKAAYSHGVTKAISAPIFDFGGQKGVSAGFRTGSLHAWEKGAVWQDEIALHYPLVKSEAVASLSAAVGQLKAKLLKSLHGNATNELSEERCLKKVLKGEMALAITVHSADLIASLLRLKLEVEREVQDSTSADFAPIRLIIIGGTESHLLAESLARANVNVVLAPMLAFAESWAQRRSLTGAPLTNGTTIDVLHAAGVKVAIGTDEDWQTRNLYLNAGIAYANGGDRISEADALAFVSTNIYDMLGLGSGQDHTGNEYVVFDGSPLEIDSRIRAVADGSGKVTVWD